MKPLEKMSAEEMIEFGLLVPARSFEQGNVYVVLVDENGEDELYKFEPGNYVPKVPFGPH